MSDSNLVLIGMPAAGKSTVGRLVAQAERKPFVDTDDLIAQAAGKPLRELIREDGLETFRETERACVLGLHARDSVIATGGSVVYCEEAMQHLAAGGLVVFLDAPLAELEERLADMEGRAVLRGSARNVAELAAERRPLYERWAQQTVACSAAEIPAVVERIRAILARRSA